METERQNALHRELFEANPDMAPSHFSCSAESKGLLSLREELKRLKFVFTEAETQRRFAEYAKERNLGEVPRTANKLSEQRKEAKDKNKALKMRIAREEEAHRQQFQELKAAYQRAKELHENCLQEVKAMAALQDRSVVDEDFDMDIEEAGQRNIQAAEAASDRAKQLSDLWYAREQQSMKRRKLEDELSTLETERRAKQAQRLALFKEEQKERRKVEALQLALEAEARLGLPRIELDVERGLVLLGQPSESAEEAQQSEAMRSVKVEWAEDGRLLRAEPNDALEMQPAAKHAIATDDLAALLTKVWGKLCDTTEGTITGQNGLCDRFQRLSAGPLHAGA